MAPQLPQRRPSCAIGWPLLAGLVLVLAPAGRALDNGLALTPPMGWLAWARFTCTTDCASYPDDCINEHLFEQMAERLSQDGWAQLGYQYINIDDCWQEMQRQPDTERLVANRSRFPSGLGPLAGRLHGLGLKLGIYGDCGLKTCAGYPAQLKPTVAQAGRRHESDNYFQLDAQTFADWQLDSFKFDGCHIDPAAAERVCPAMSAALNATGRQVLLVCEWPFYLWAYTHSEPDFELAGASCNVWRYYDDIEDSWLSILNTIDYTVRHQSTIVKFHGPGHWFDPDQLVIGNFGLSLGQARAQMAIWCLWSAPLYMGNDLRSVRPEARAILQNRHLIELDQDRLGVLGLMSQQSADGSHMAFVKPVLPVSERTGCPSFAIVYLNRFALGNSEKVSFKLADLLLGAPIGQAARHQAASDLAGPRIRLRDCLGHLRRGLRRAQLVAAAEAGSGPDEPWAVGEPARRPDQAAVELDFEARDLFHDAHPIHFDWGPSIGPADRLELLVEPSSVRALKLVEREPAN